MTEFIRTQLMKLCDNPEWFNDMMNTWDFKPDYYYEILVTDVEGYIPTFIEYYAWDEDEDGPIPGIKLFKDFNIYLERKYCEY